MLPSFWLFKWKSNALICEEAKAICEGMLCSKNGLPPIFFLLCFSFPRCLNAVQVLDLSSVTVFIASVYKTKCKNPGPTVARDLNLILIEGTCSM